MRPQEANASGGHVGSAGARGALWPSDPENTGGLRTRRCPFLRTAWHCGSALMKEVHSAAGGRPHRCQEGAVLPTGPLQVKAVTSVQENHVIQGTSERFPLEKFKFKTL